MPKRIVQTLFSLFLLMAGCDPAFAASLNINKFRGNDRDNDPLMVSGGMSPESQNIVTDAAEGLGPRPGFVAFSTEACGAGPWIFPHSNGSRYFITLSSNTLKATLGGTNFTIILGTADPSVRTGAASLGDKFFWSSSDGLRYWDAVSVTIVSGTLTFDNLVAHKGRLFGSGVAGDKRTIYVSKYLDGTSWNLVVNPTDDDPARVQVQGSLDENIFGLFSSFQDALVWFKANSFGAIYGSRRSTFQSVVYSQNIGSAYPESVKDCDGELRFLGSRRTVWGFNGRSVYRLTKSQSDTSGIDSLMQTISQGDANSRSWTQTTQADWNSGTIGVGLSTTIVVGDLILPFQNAPDYEFQDNDYTNNPTWTVASGSFSVINGALRDGTPYLSPAANNDIISVPSVLNNATWYWVNSSSFSDYDDVAFMNDTPGNFHNGYSVQYFLNSPGAFVQIIRLSADLGDTVVASTVIATTMIGSILQRTKITRNQNGVFRLYFGNADILAATGVDTTYTSSQYFAMRGSTNQYRFAIESIVTESTMAVAATFLSQAFKIGNNIASWSNFTDNDSNVGNIAYRIFADTDGVLTTSNPTTFVASQTISNGQIPTIATGSYVVIEASFTRTSGQTPVLHDFTVTWNEGSQLRVASLWTNQRYWLGVAISSAGNNTVLVYDRNRQWQFWNGINMTGAVMNGSQPYFGNAGGIYQAEVGYNDNGVAIPATFKTQAYYPAAPNYRSMFDNLYLTTINSAETLHTVYYVDGVNSAYSLADLVMDTDNGYQDAMLPFGDNVLAQGKIIQFKFSVNSTTNWRLLNASLYFDAEKVLHNN